jgi:pyridoxamine 5'-phosphate oxidase
MATATNSTVAADAVAVAAPWLKSLTRTITLNASIAFSKYFQLATVSAQGMPSVRTVVYRGMSADNIIMVTDNRSEKMQHLRAQPHAEIAWYFPLTREQFRIFGRVVTIDCSAEEADAESAESSPDSVAASSSSSTSSWRAVFASRADAAAYRQRAWAAQTDTARLSYDQAHPGHPRPAQSRSDLDKVCAAAFRSSCLDVSFSTRSCFRTITIMAGFHRLPLPAPFFFIYIFFFYQYNAQPQDIARVSPHFTVLLLLPSRVDHLTLPSTKPDPRRPAHYESVLQPSKTGVRARNVVALHFYLSIIILFCPNHLLMACMSICHPFFFAHFCVSHSHGGCTSSTRQKESGRRPS